MTDDPIERLRAAVTEAEKDMAADAEDAEARGERVDLATYEVVLDLDDARGILAALAAENREIAWLKRRIEGLDGLRPVWAQGWTDDSGAAQASAAALAQLWRMLGAENQTQATAALAAKDAGIAKMTAECARRDRDRAELHAKVAETKARAEKAEAAVATLAAQVEAMRDGIDMAKRRLETIADEAWSGDARDFKRRIPGVFADFDAALTGKRTDDG